MASTYKVTVSEERLDREELEADSVEVEDGVLKFFESELPEGEHAINSRGGLVAAFDSWEKVERLD